MHFRHSNIRNGRQCPTSENRDPHTRQGQTRLSLTSTRGSS